MTIQGGQDCVCWRLFSQHGQAMLIFQTVILTMLTRLYQWLADKPGSSLYFGAVGDDGNKKGDRSLYQTWAVRGCLQSWRTPWRRRVWPRGWWWSLTSPLVTVWASYRGTSGLSWQTSGRPLPSSWTTSGRRTTGAASATAPSSTWRDSSSHTARTSCWTSPSSPSPRQENKNKITRTLHCCPNFSISKNC